jgi:branched-chain amino acid transport system ATP-binding protein
MLTLSDVSVSFQRTTILKGVSLTIQEGETVGIIGPNGSGKTTLFNYISGFVSGSTGTLSLRSTDISWFSPDERSRLGIGRVFQNFGIFREMTVLENMLVALESHGSLLSTLIPFSAATKRNKAKALELLNEVNLASRANEKAGSLSGGQSRLLEIMRIIAVGADLLLLDEPTAGVSPRMKDEVARCIEKLQLLGKTLLVIEHDINFIQKFCKRIVVLEGGNVVLDDTPERVYADERLQEIYFGKSRAVGEAP